MLHQESIKYRRSIITFSIYVVNSILLSQILISQTLLQNKLDSLLEGFPQNGPGGVVVVLDQSKNVFSGSWGFANIEWKIPNALDVKYRIGSITKTFTALAVLQLAEKGKLSIKDKAGKWLPEAGIDDRITIEHLLSHTSGIQAERKELEFNPGEKINYSNFGYLLLGQIIAKASGEPYEQYLRENIFRPLDMTNSGYDHNQDILSNRASGYRLGEKGFINAYYSDMEVPGAAGGLYSTVQDMVKFERSLYGNSIFSKSILESAFKPFTLNSGQKTKYGFGWITDSYRGWREISTGGDIEGFNSFFSHFPDKKRTIIVLQNITMQMGADWSVGSRLAHHIADIAWGNEMEPSPVIIRLPDEKLQSLAGVYEFVNAPAEMVSAMGPRITVSVEKGNLFLQDKNTRLQVAALGDRDFIVPNLDLSIKFVTGTDNKITGLIINIMGIRELVARRVDQQQ